MKTFSAALLVLVFSLTATPQTPPAKPKAAKSEAPAPPTVEQILDRYITALGGREAYERITTRTLRGTVKMKMGPDELPTGKVQILAKAPDRQRFTFDFEGFIFEEGF